MSSFSDKFVSQSEVDEKKKKRQEEWDKVRKPDDPVECPEEVVDNRSLYDKLQEQKMKKQEEYDEQHKLKNSVHGLGEDEAHFLDFVSKKQMELNKARDDEEKSLFKELKESSVSQPEPSTSTQKASKVTKTTQPNKKSQTALLAGAVKRKGSAETEESKKRKTNEDNVSSTVISDAITVQKIRNHQPKIIGVLPGMGCYDNDTSDSDTSSSDSECDFSLVKSKIKIQVEQQ